MTPEQNQSCAGWTLPTLYTHFNALLAAQKEAVGIAQDAADRAMVKAENASDARFAGVNEFRQSLNDYQRTLMPRTESEIRFKAIEDKVITIEKVLLENQGKGEGRHASWGYIVGGIGVLALIVDLILRFK